MSRFLKGYEWRGVYRSGDQDLLNDFYIPALARACTYDRAVGFFSARVLSAALKGLVPFLKHQGQIRLVIGHPLSPQEYAAVTSGACNGWVKQKVLELIESVVSSDAEISRFDNHAACLLAYLATEGHIDIRFAFRLQGMYHEKIGIMRDQAGDAVVFCGSANETVFGLEEGYNAESITVYRSWETSIFESYALPFVEGFERLWAGGQLNTKTVSLDSEVYEKIASLAPTSNLNELEAFELSEDERYHLFITEERSKPLPELPTKFNGRGFFNKKTTRTLLCWLGRNLSPTVTEAF